MEMRQEILEIEEDKIWYYRRGKRKKAYFFGTYNLLVQQEVLVVKLCFFDLTWRKIFDSLPL